MSILTQGSQVFFVDTAGSSPSIMEVQCATAINPGSAPADQIEDNCLKHRERSYKPGMRTPGQGTLTLNADPQYDSHIRMHQLYEADPPPSVIWIVGWSDGPLDSNGEPNSLPTLDSSGELQLPNDRTWYVFRGYVADFPFDFQGNSLVATQVSIQRTRSLPGDGWRRKAP
jgi:hypothetical protein